MKFVWHTDQPACDPFGQHMAELLHTFRRQYMHPLRAVVTVKRLVVSYRERASKNQSEVSHLLSIQNQPYISLFITPMGRPIITGSKFLWLDC